ncbi:hypothetical protein Moror_6245 [Moniliophthora roreri MCA 2997]|uniref:F-box domain-containing protein n=1 Tax=Moniliophthora roreri (strain MCA 2997) TaxID=1381753 RepID=V2WV41_MONRO|nr:hypothetical protein Moror_6245 [Moniliophthora roreri MCA 2997]
MSNIQHDLKIPKAIKCLQTVRRNNLAAKSVHYFKLKESISLFESISTQLFGLLRLLSEALQRMVNLRGLNLTASGDGYEPESWPMAEIFGRIFDHLSFPRLREAWLYTPVSHGVVDFLQRHRTHIEALCLDGIAVAGGDTRLLDRPIKFPNLRFLDASQNITSTIFSPWELPNLTMITVTWSYDRENISPFDLLLTSTAKFSKANQLQPNLELFRKGWNVDLIEAVSVQLPQIRKLCIGCMHYQEFEKIPMDAMLDVTRYLKRFSDLRRFQWFIEAMEDPPPPCFSMYRAYEITVSLGEMCHSLEFCQLPYGPVWQRIVDDIWIPEEEMDCDAITDDNRLRNWMWNQLVHERYPKLDDLLGFRDTAGGSVERMQATEELLELGQHTGIWNKGAVDKIKISVAASAHSKPDVHSMMSPLVHALKSPG